MRQETLKEFPDSAGLKVGSLVNHGLAGNAKIVAIKGSVAEIVDRFGKHIKVQLSSLQSGEIKERKVTEGTWAIPDTEEGMKGLKKLMAKPILAKNAMKVLYNFVGDDRFFDNLQALKDDYPESDVRDEVKAFLKKNWPKLHKQLTENVGEEMTQFKLLSEIKNLIPTSSLNEALDRSAMTKMLNGFEKKLPHAARFKSFDFDLNKKHIYWVTQSTETAESKEAAEEIASLMADSGFPGWKIHVIIRDEYFGDDSPKTKWQTAKS